ncbi:MAG: hypothetical protein ACOCSN_07675 [Halanaeroarchaeum sp.]
MSHSHDARGNPDGRPTGPSMNTLADAPTGGLHLLVTYEIPAATGRTDGGDAAGAEFVGSVVSPGKSTLEYTGSEFDEAVDVESLVSYLGLDFVEHELFADQFPDDEVVYTSRGVGTYQLLCVYAAGKGVLLVVDEDEAIKPLVDDARTILGEA